ncbi:class I SAM-dependent methyltransferase [Azospirillum sp. BE72]|uniref:class I SAM-dependent methyltransferase n=1 Tax=Azospirillum sp. BE72 TaxID=2817776 RepID=UPI00285BBC88|nr:class I SAM-dependent methyltransferase [Azospirillum sp. BE72]MDR6774199.1 SAM-dependent methyltransferase [Azospirillum sp. BE72]
MPEFNLLRSVPKIVRDIPGRLANKEENRRLALAFGAEYFDGPRTQGYGGYHYDGRWVAVARTIIDRYRLKPGDRVLDIGCAKGFLMKDLMDLMPGLEVWGLDISAYAIRNAHPDVAKRILQGSCDRLPFADDSFALALSINTIHNLEQAGCREALREMQRVAPGAGFVQVDAYRNQDELDLLMDWMLTARTYCTPDVWREIFMEAGYSGDYYWTIFEKQ